MFRIPPGPLSGVVASRLERMLAFFEARIDPSSPNTPLLGIGGGFWDSDSVNDEVINSTFRAIITDYDCETGFYAWEEYLLGVEGTSDPLSEWQQAPGGKNGTTTLNPAQEANGVVVPVGTIVDLQRSSWNDTYGWIHSFNQESDVQIIKITGEKDGCYYPGVLMRFDPDTCTWSECEEVYVVDANGT